MKSEGFLFVPPIMPYLSNYRKVKKVCEFFQSYEKTVQHMLKAMQQMNINLSTVALEVEADEVQAEVLQIVE